MEKLGLTMEDIKEAQKQAAAKKASGRSSAAQADGQKNGNGTVNAPKKREEQKGKAVRVHNTPNTAMGKLSNGHGRCDL